MMRIITLLLLFVAGISALRVNKLKDRVSKQLDAGYGPCKEVSGTCIDTKSNDCSRRFITLKCPGDHTILCCPSPGIIKPKGSVNNPCQKRSGTCIDTASDTCTNFKGEAVETEKLKCMLGGNAILCCPVRDPFDRMCNPNAPIEEQTASCSGQGTCDDGGACVCNAGFFGLRCEKACDRATTCGGRGECNAEGNCVCDAQFDGANCGECKAPLKMFPTCEAFPLDFDQATAGAADWPDASGKHKITPMAGKVRGVGVSINGAVQFGPDQTKTATGDVDLSPSKLAQLSIEVWVKPIVNQNSKDCVINHDNGGFDRGISLFDSRFGGISFGVGRIYASTLGFPELNQWVHLVGTFENGQTCTFFKDVATTQELLVNNDEGLPQFTIGGNPGFPDEEAFMWLGRLRIFAHRLTSAEVQTNFASTQSPRYVRIAIPPPFTISETNTALGELSLAGMVGKFDITVSNCKAVITVKVTIEYDDGITAAEQAIFEPRFFKAIADIWGTQHGKTFFEHKIVGRPADQCACSIIPIIISAVKVSSDPNKQVKVHRANGVDSFGDVDVNLGTSDLTLAHEFGHCLALWDEYPERRNVGETLTAGIWHKDRPDDPNNLMYDHGGNIMRSRFFKHYARFVQNEAPSHPQCEYSIDPPGDANDHY